jgi:citrate lyase subunit gamma (acyl carrier protein)
MKLPGKGRAGTLESGDILIEVEPIQSNTEIFLRSSVMSLYGQQIRAVLLRTLEELDLQGVLITAQDKGALDCTIRARLLTAVARAGGPVLPWQGEVQV